MANYRELSRIPIPVFQCRRQLISGPDPHCQQEWLEFASETPWRIDMEIPRKSHMETRVGYGSKHEGFHSVHPKIAGVDVKSAPEIWKILGNVIQHRFLSSLQRRIPSQKSPNNVAAVYASWDALHESLPKGLHGHTLLAAHLDERGEWGNKDGE